MTIQAADRALSAARGPPEAFYLVREWTVDTDGRGRIYVLDLSNARVAMFDSTGRGVR